MPNEKSTSVYASELPSTSFSAGSSAVVASPLCTTRSLEVRVEPTHREFVAPGEAGLEFGSRRQARAFRRERLGGLVVDAIRFGRADRHSASSNLQKSSPSSAFCNARPP